MITSGRHSRSLTLSTTIQFLVRTKWVFGLAIAALLAVAATPPPQVSDEDTDLQYIHIMNLIDRADALRASGKADAAKAKDIEAYKALVMFQRVHPRWYPKTVEYRLNELDQEIEGRPAETAEAESAPKPHTNLEAPVKKSSSSKSAVKLLDPGSQPRKVLRLHVKPGDKQTMILTIKASMDMPAMAGRGAPGIPPLNVPADVSVDSVAPNGDITFDAVLGEVSLASSAGLPPQAVAQAKKAFGTVKGFTVTMLLSSHGDGRLLSIKAPPGAPPDMEQGISKAQQTISTMHTTTPILALPEEPVGPGAKWEVKTDVTTNGMAINTTATYQLESVDGDRISVSKKVDFSVNGSPTGPGVMPTPMPMGSVNISGDWTGTSALDLAKVLPTQSTSDIKLAMNMAPKSGNATQSMAMKMDINFSLEAH